MDELLKNISVSHKSLLIHLMLIKMEVYMPKNLKIERFSQYIIKKYIKLYMKKIKLFMF